MSNRRRVGVRGIIWHDRKLLLVKHKDSAGRPKDFWAIPGGGLDPGESLVEGVKREIKEELNLEADVGRLLFIQQFISTRGDCDEELEFFFLVENSADFLGHDEAHSTHGEAELASCQFLNPKDHNIKPEFIKEIILEDFIRSQQPVFFYSRL